MHKALKAKERELKDAEIEMRRLNKEKSVIEEERKELLKQKAKLELELEEAESRAGTDQENQEVQFGGVCVCVVCVFPMHMYADY